MHRRDSSSGDDDVGAAVVVVVDDVDAGVDVDSKIGPFDRFVGFVVYAMHCDCADDYIATVVAVLG